MLKFRVCVKINHLILKRNYLLTYFVYLSLVQPPRDHVLHVFFHLLFVYLSFDALWKLLLRFKYFFLCITSTLNAS